MSTIPRHRAYLSSKPILRRVDLLSDCDCGDYYCGSCDCGSCDCDCGNGGCGADSINSRLSRRRDCQRQYSNTKRTTSAIPRAINSCIVLASGHTPGAGTYGTRCPVTSRRCEFTPSGVQVASVSKSSPGFGANDDTSSGRTVETS